MDQLRHGAHMGGSAGSADHSVAPDAKAAVPAQVGRRKSDGQKHARAASEARDGKSALVVPQLVAEELARSTGHEGMHDGHTHKSWGMDDDLSADAEHALRQSQEELRQLSARLLTIQENERQRIAADLHDGIGQSLSLIKLSMGSVAQLITSGRHQDAVEALRRMIGSIDDAMSELRRTTSDLRPPTLDDLGIVATLSWFFREFEFACREKMIERNLNVTESDVPPPLKPTIFRILQEAMNNIVKHANADWIRVSLNKAAGAIELSIEDNGQGFDPEAVATRKGSSRGFGLLTMKERAISSNGTFAISSGPGQGTRIDISWLLTDAGASHGGGEVPHARD